MDEKLTLASSAATDDPRLKIIEVLLTLGGFLGIILALPQSQISQVKDIFAVFIVLFVVSAFLTYSGIILNFPKKKLGPSLALLAGSFGGLLALAVFPSVEGAAISIGFIATSAGLSTTGAQILFVVVFLVVELSLYYTVSSAIRFVLKEPPPSG